MARTGDNNFAQPWQEFKKEFGGAPLLHGPIENIFKGWDELLVKMGSKYEFPAPDDSVKTEDVKINDLVTVRVYTPPNATGSDNLGVYFHGGGWAMGDLNIEDAQCRIISKECNIVLVSVDYRLAPKHKYPAALDDSYAGVIWALDNRATLGANNNPIALIGTSAGGGLSLSVAIKMIQNGNDAQLAGVAALVPVTIHPSALPAELKNKYTSYDEHAEDTVNTKDAMMVFFDAYGGEPQDPLISPLLHNGVLKKAKKVYITECGMDTLRDDARLMKENLESQNVAVRYDTYPGYPHYSWTLPSKKLAGHQAEFFENLVNGVNWVFGQGP